MFLFVKFRNNFIWKRRLLGILPTYVNCQQEDAHEFMRFFLDSIDQDTVRNTFAGCMKNTSEFWRIYFVSVVDFVYFYDFAVICDSCHTLSETMEPFLDISLNIHNVENVEDAIFLHMQSVKLFGENAYMCSRYVSVLYYLDKIVAFCI
jgi:ubiquitin carboxyl-terminal hydrolase 36/42